MGANAERATMGETAVQRIAGVGVLFLHALGDKEVCQQEDIDCHEKKNKIKSSDRAALKADTLRARVMICRDTKPFTA